MSNTEYEYHQNLIPVTVKGRNTLAIINTGADISCISLKFAQKCNMRVIKNNMKTIDVYATGGRKLGVLGKATVNLGLGDINMTYIFYVVKQLNRRVLLEIDFLRTTGCNIDLQNNCISFHVGKTVLPLQTLKSTMSLLKSLEHISLPPRTEALISVKLTNKAAERFHSKRALIEPFITAGQRGICVAKALVNKPDTNKLLCRVLNPFNKLCKIPRNYIVETLTSVELTGDERDRDNTPHFALHDQFAGHSNTA